MAYGSQHSFAMVLETGGYAVTPATPVFFSVPITKFAGGVSMDQIEDTTIRGDRQIAYVVNGAISNKFSATETLRYGAYDSLFEAASCGTWAAGTGTSFVLSSGVTYRSFTGERHFGDMTGKPYFRHTGVELAKMSLKCGKDALIETTLDFVAQDENSASGIVSGATYGAIPTSVAPFDSFNAVISVGGTAQTVVEDFTLELDNTPEEKRVVGSRLAIQPAMLFSRVSGSIQCYFDSPTLFDIYKPGTATAIDLLLTDPAGNHLEFSAPKALLGGDANRDVSGPGAVHVTFKFKAYLDPSTGTNLVITRTPHA